MIVCSSMQCVVRIRNVTVKLLQAQTVLAVARGALWLVDCACDG
jgi:hypothetical protein